MGAKVMITAERDPSDCLRKRWGLFLSNLISAKPPLRDPVG